MSIVKKLGLACSFVLTFQSLLYSQVIPNLLFQDDTILYEKLYLHIDREIYSPGDDIWFKSYLVSGINNQLISGFKNIYIQLIAEDGRIIDQRLMLSVNGISNNDFHIPDTLSKGQYTIRGFTKYLQNFGEESLFHQKIAVSAATDLPDLENKSEELKVIDVSFLPEGGNMVMNATNYVAFKAINEKGKEIQVSGKIIDETGNEIVSFESKYNGMGTFVMMPKEGKKYYARIDGYPGFTYQFEDARIDGITLHYQQKGDYLQFILNQNFKLNNTKNLVLAVSQKGQELFSEEVEMTGFQFPVEIYKGFFPLGISKITVFDAQNNILAERLVFVRNSDDKTLLITSDKNEYLPREKVTLKIESLLNPDDGFIENGLSVAVVNTDYFSVDGRNESIESYLLLDSELKGPLESPATFFTDEENISADEKLDLVMMINGWRKYYWDELENYFKKPLPGWADIGLTFKGEVKSLFGGKAVEGDIVKLGPFSSQFLILKDTTDKQGRFSFNGLYLKDSAQIMVNAKNKKDKNDNVEIFYETVPVFDSVIPFGKLSEVNQAAREIEIPEKFNQAAHYRYLAEQEFKLAEGSILLQEVEVKEKLRTPPNITGLYGFPTRSYMLSDADRKYQDILKFLEIEVPNVFVSQDEILIGFAKIPPKIFVDGYLPAFDIQTMSMDDIAKIEIINPSKAFSTLFVTNSEGVDIAVGAPSNQGGVISILTKTGFGKFNDDFERIIHGRINPQVRGFSQTREFYSPKYTLENIENEKPDYRPTLYWSPDVMVDESKASIEFFTGDNLADYVVIVEGISTKGKICYATALIKTSISKD